MSNVAIKKGKSEQDEKNIKTNLLEEDVNVSKILDQLFKKADKEFVNNNEITKNCDYLLYDKINNNYKTKDLKNYVYDCFVKFKRLTKINDILYKGKYLYIFITPIKDQSNKNRIIIKIGYTQNLEERQKTLETELKCKIYLLGYRLINGLADENILHNYLRNKYKALYYPLMKKLNSKKNEEYTEYYILDPSIMAEYMKYDVHLPNMLEIEQEKTKQEEEKTKQKELDLKQKELDLKQKDKEIEILKLQIQLKQIDKNNVN